MTTIEFRHTSIALLNTGIISLYNYLERCANGELFLNYPISFDNFSLDKDKLTITHDKLFQLLEDIYYLMGKEVYDLQKSDGNKKYYFIKEPFQDVEFITMNSYGLSGLITKPPLGPQPTSRNDEDWESFTDIYNNDIDFANNIAKFYFNKRLLLKGFDILNGQAIINENQKKGDSKIFLNTIYTKTPKLPKEKALFENGKQECYLTGEKFKKLTSFGSTTPFLSEQGERNYKEKLYHRGQKTKHYRLFVPC